MTRDAGFGGAIQGVHGSFALLRMIDGGAITS